MTNTSTTTTEEATCSCGRPVAEDPFGEIEGVCGPHLRVRVADERVDGWERAHEMLRGRIYDALDHEDPGHLEDIIYSALEKVRVELARAYHELDVAERVASHKEGDEIRGRARTLEEAEVGYRLYLRSEELARASDVVYDAPGLKGSERWRMLAVLQAAKEEADEEFRRYLDRPVPTERRTTWRDKR